MVAPRKSSAVRSVEIPPRRGKVKREIFVDFAKSIALAAAKAAGGVFVRNAGVRSSSTSTATTTPPTSGYSSDHNSEAS